MGNQDGVPVKTLTGHGANSMPHRYETPPHHLFPTVSQIVRYPRKRPCRKEKQGLLGMSYPEDVRAIRKSLTRKVISDEHQLPIILWIRIEGLDELGYRSTHQVGLVDLIGVADGGHLFLEDDG